MIAGLALIAGGCEKKPDATSALDQAKQATQAAADKAKDAAKSAGDAAKAAGDKAAAAATDASKAAGDAAKAAGDKAKDMGNAAIEAAKAPLKNLMDTAKTKLDGLVKGGASLTGDKKGEFDKAVTGIQSTFGDLTKGFDGLKDLKLDTLTTKVKEMTTKGEGLLKSINDTAAKFGIKL